MLRRVDYVFVTRETIWADIAVAVKAETESFVNSAELPTVSLAVQTKIRTIQSGGLAHRPLQHIA